MAAATLRPQMTAATEHGQEVLLLQSTAMSANVVFINIDCPCAIRQEEAH